MIKTWNEGTCRVKDKKFTIDLELISRAIGMSNEGMIVKREVKVKKLEERDKFFKKVMKSKKLDKY